MSKSAKVTRELQTQMKAIRDVERGKYDPPTKYGPLQGLAATNRELELNGIYQKTWRDAKK